MTADRKSADDAREVLPQGREASAGDALLRAASDAYTLLSRLPGGVDDENYHVVTALAAALGAADRNARTKAKAEPVAWYRPAGFDPEEPWEAIHTKGITDRTGVPPGWLPVYTRAPDASDAAIDDAGAQRKRADRAEAALRGLVDRNAAYIGSQVQIDYSSHSEAFNAIQRARDVLRINAARAASQERGEGG